ncbi:hypothetical protein QNZ47_004562 [Enterobacter cloacae]|nr:hypothetical protein [Enterobacter cloacae]
MSELYGGRASSALRGGVSRHALWGVWLTWGLVLVLWVNAGDGGILHHPRVSAGAAALWLTGCGLLVLNLIKGKREMQLLKKRRPAEGVQTLPPAPAEGGHEARATASLSGGAARGGE